MKVFTCLALASTTMAVAVGSIKSWNLRAIAPDAPFNKWLVTINNEGILGLNVSTTSARFYTTPGAVKDTYSLHGYPIGIIDTPGFLVGDNTYNIAFLSNPLTSAAALGPNIMMGNWTVNSKLGQKSGPGNGRALGYDFEEKWYAWPAGSGQQWSVKWWDGSCCVTEDYLAVKLELVSVKTD